MTRRRILTHAIIIFILAAVVRGVYLAEMRESQVFRLLVIDEQAYDLQAMEKVHGDWVGRKVFYQDPLYPYFLAILFRAFGHQPFAAFTLDAALLLLLVARRRQQWGLWLAAGLVAAIYAPFFFQETLILKSSLVLFTLDAALLLLLVARRRQQWGLWLAAGAVLGLGILVRGNYLLFAPVAATWIAVVNWKHSLGRAVRCALLFVAGVAAMILPVTVRNYAVARDLVLTTSQAGTNFYTANHPGNRTGTLVPPPFVNTVPAFEDEDFKREAERRSGRRGMKASEVSRFWLRQALTSIAQHPRLFFVRTWKKLRFATTNYEPPDNQSFYFVRRYFSTTLRLDRVTFGVIFPFAAVGLLLCLRRRRPATLLYLFLATYLASLLIFYVFARSRLPLVPPLIILAAFAGVSLVRQWRETRLVEWMAAGLLFILSAVWAWSFTARVDLVKPWTNLGAAYSVRGEPDEAERSFIRAVGVANAELAAPRKRPDVVSQIEVGLSTAHYGLGHVALVKNDLTKAQAHYQQAIELDGNNWQAHAELATVLRKKGELSAAEREALRANELYPYAPPVHIELALIYTLLRRPTKAVHHFKIVLELDPHHPQAATIRQYIQQHGGD